MSTPMRPIVSTSSAVRPGSRSWAGLSSGRSSLHQPLQPRRHAARIASSRPDRVSDPGHGLKVYRPGNRTSILCPDKVSNRGGVRCRNSRSTVCSSRRSLSTDPAPSPCTSRSRRRLQEQIEGGELPVGGRLENEVELADRLGVSRPTMRKAIGYLVERGMLVRRRGVGTQIVHPKVRRPGGADQPLRRPREDRPRAADGGPLAGGRARHRRRRRDAGASRPARR